MSKQKVAILGGGVSAMTAAVYMTEQEDWQERYDITVYQQGWRLGGKGASGRNAEYGERIEEHGLHVWFGAYVNSFRAIETVYNKLERSSDVPIHTWQQALKPHSLVVLQEYIDQQWQTWSVDFPEIPGNPANGTLDLHFWQILKLLAAWLHKWVDDLECEVEKTHKSTQLKTKKERDKTLLAHLGQEVKSFFDSVEDKAKTLFDDAENHVQEVVSTPKLLITQLSNFLTVREADHRLENKKDHLVVWYMVRKIRRWLQSEVNDLIDDNPVIRRLYICIDLGVAMTIGMLRDKVYSRGFGYLDRYDFKQWLKRNGANESLSVESAPVRGFYDLVFGYEDGDFKKPNVEAGVAALAMLRIMLCYRGGVMWKMQAGMGDIIFSPIYELLKHRGVKFAFFHQVESLHCAQDDDGHYVDSIQLIQQVKLKETQNYEPLELVKDLPCWPSFPLWQQIDPQQAALLKEHEINLESYWSNWETVYQQAFGQRLPRKTLNKGTDFDLVIFGISVAGLEPLCQQLLAKDNNLKLQAEKVKTVATQALQLWLTKTDNELGFHDPSGSNEPPILSAFSQPFDTWAAMSNLIEVEDWPNTQPKNIAYFCSAFTCADYPPPSDHEFPERMKAQVKENALQKLRLQMQPLWPEAYHGDDFDWNVLFDVDNNEGEVRFNTQYWRVNVDPSERYVLSVVDSSQFRLPTDGSVFNNLYITGDWIKTGVNAGCVEAAVMAGMQTSRAITGYPQSISGESGFEPFNL
ncbi:NAD(P)-binding protein [Pseudoalteromonas piscicida]|uniref:NAD(P)-binding protein n=1 Tax=Pseudoalteromonas piscicida TaxID=43662 RepID=UPI001C98837C|nr:NAD(P)-binding protein [Pseudoalteromonas piscicida]QZO14396.1 NAD(P)-binding protein [Pseudoalteromonas piscicida]